MNKIKKSRKAMVWPYVLALFTALVIIVVLFGLPKEVSDVGESTAMDIACQNSLFYAQAYQPIKIEGTDIIDKNGDPVHLKCPTKYEKTSKTKEKDLAFEVANLVSNCKNLYKKQGDLFDTTIRSVCIVCSSLEMPKEEIKEFLPNLKELKPVAAPQSNYLQYLFGKTDTSSIEASKSLYYDLDTGGRLAIVFVAGIERITQFMDFDDYGIGLVRYKNLNSLNCHVLEGETELKVI